MTASIHFDLLLPRRIVFGWGERRQLGSLAQSLGQRAFLVAGSRTLQATSIWKEMMDSLTAVGVVVEPMATITQEPTLEDVDQAASTMRRFQPGRGDFVLGIGGGAALDLAKAVAAMGVNDGPVRDYLEGIGSGRTLQHDPLPILAVPTTSGTGSEATKNAVISCNDPPCKKSLRSEKLLPSIALVDPELTVSLPFQQTAYSGLDAVTQLMESYFTRRAQPVTDAWCDMGLKLALGSLLKACHFPSDRQAREEMAAASLLSGMALANSGLGMAHGVAAALGASCQVPHGLACAVMLPMTLKANQESIAAKAEQLKIFWKQRSGPAGGQLHAPAIEVLRQHVENLCRTLNIPTRLRDIGIRKEQIPELVAGSRGNSMNGNPREISDQELQTLLEENL